MAREDYLTTPTADNISGADITINQATAQPSGGTRFLSTFAQGIMKGGGAEAKLKKEKDKLEYYTSLREAGYSAEEATARVNKQFSGSFLERALGKNSAGFDQPSQDNFVSKNAKTNAEIAALKARAARDDRYTGNTKNNQDKEAASVLTKRSEQLSNAIFETKSALKTEKDPAKKVAMQTKLAKYEAALDKFMLGSEDEESTASTGSAEGP